MDCLVVADLLTRLEADPNAVDATAIDALARMGLIARTAGGEGPAETLRTKLRELQDHRQALRIVAAEATGTEIARLEQDAVAVDAEIREVRSRILASGSGPARWSLTFRGRDLLGEITSRRDRLANVSIEAFQRRMTELRSALAGTVDKAAKILALIAPRTTLLDEAQCRSAAVGLAKLGGPAEFLADQWIARISDLRVVTGGGAVDEADRGVVAEQLALTESRNVQEFCALVQSLRPACSSSADAVDSASIAWRLPADQRAALHAKAKDLGTPNAPLAPAYLAASGNAVAYAALVPALVAAGGPPDTARVAAAFLAMSGDDAATALDRYRAVQAWMDGIADEGVPVLAAMVCLIRGAPPGILDDLRLACAEVARAKLAVDGSENLALGVKLLLDTQGVVASLVGSAADSPTAALLPTIAVAAIAAPVSASFQRGWIVRPMTVYRPSHTHSSYG